MQSSQLAVRCKKVGLWAWAIQLTQHDSLGFLTDVADPSLLRRRAELGTDIMGEHLNVFSGAQKAD